MLRLIPLCAFSVVLLVMICSGRMAQARTLSDDEQLIAVGVGAFNDGFYDIAEKNLSDFVQTYPQHRKFYDVAYLLGRTYLISGKWKEARSTFLRILRDNRFENLDHVLFWLGSIETRLGHLEEARKAFLSLTQRFPKFERMDEAYYALGLLDMGSSQWAAAESSLKKVSQISKKPELLKSANFWLGVSLFKRSDYEKAISHFQVLTKSPPSPALIEIVKYAFIWLGEAYLRSNQFTEARATYQTFLSHFRNDGLSSEASWKVALCEYRLGHIQEAREVLQEFRNRANDPRALVACHYLLGEISLFLDEYATAIKEWDSILQDKQAFPAWSASLVGQFWNHVQLGDMEEANRAFQKLIKMPQSEQEQHFVQWLYGNLLFSLGKVSDALPYYFNILNSGFREKALFQIGKGYFFLEKFGESITNLDILLLEFPNSRYVDEGLFIKGECLVHMGDLDRALETFTLLTKQRRGLSWQLMAWIQIGDLSLLRREEERAQQAFKQAMLTSPDHPLAYYSAFQLGNLHARKKNWGESIHYYSLVVRGNISEWLGEAHFRLGEVFYQQEKYEKAFASFETAMRYLSENSPWFFLAHLELGNLLRRWERYDEARRSYKAILDHSKDEDLRTAAKELLNRVDSLSRGQTS